MLPPARGSSHTLHMFLSATTLMSLGAFALTALVVALLVRPWVPAFRTLFRDAPRGLRGAWLIALLGSAVLLGRPHDDTLLGLDTTGYRLMAEALAEGRPLRGPDRVLQEVPYELRTAFLFLPDMHWRNSRDISFQITNLDPVETVPYFYPWLPLNAAGFDRLIPGAARDYFVPAVGWLFFALVLTVGTAWGGWAGLAVAIALLVGTPLPAWYFRGFYPEAVACILVGLVWLRWLRGPGGWMDRLATFAALGLALSFHPLLIVLVAPTLVMLLLTDYLGFRRLVAAGLAFACGFAPLYWMTRYVCQPYGDVFNWRRVLFNISFDGKHAVVVTASLLAAVLVLLLALMPERWWQGLQARLRTAATARFRMGLFVLAAALPLLVTLVLPATRSQVRLGWQDFYSGMQAPLAVMWLVLAVWVLFARQSLRPRLLVLVVLVTLPVFLYLKGTELAGFWSQRRWLPVAVLGAVALLPAARQAAPYDGGWRRGALAVLVLGAGLANAMRWPAPYVVRSDHPAGQWRRAVGQHLADHCTLFDYFHHSFSFAVGGQRDVLGLGWKSWHRWPQVMAWAGPRMAQHPLHIATAYANPGLEEGVRLESLGIYSSQLARVRSKRALPAEFGSSDVKLELLAAHPAQPESPPALHKVMDGGPLALRGLWLPKTQNVRSPEGEPHPAMWCREGAGILGPVPPPGGHVTVRLVVQTGRRSERDTIQMRLRLPWGGTSDWFPVAAETRVVELTLERSPDATVDVPAVAAYGFEADQLYDPRPEGIRSYPSDLMALVQRVDMTAGP